MQNNIIQNKLRNSIKENSLGVVHESPSDEDDNDHNMYNGVVAEVPTTRNLSVITAPPSKNEQVRFNFYSQALKDLKTVVTNLTNIVKDKFELMEDTDALRDGKLTPLLTTTNQIMLKYSMRWHT